MSTKVARMAVVLVGILVIGANGCSDGRPVLVAAKGEVTFKGEPLTAGSITFFPQESVGYQDDSPTSLLQIDGTFKMKTFPFGEGISPGKYKVCLSKSLAAGIKRPQYGDPKTTLWEVEIPETGDSAIALEVK